MFNITWMSRLANEGKNTLYTERHKCNLCGFSVLNIECHGNLAQPRTNGIFRQILQFMQN